MAMMSPVSCCWIYRTSFLHFCQQQSKSQDQVEGYDRNNFSKLALELANQVVKIPLSPAQRKAPGFLQGLELRTLRTTGIAARQSASSSSGDTARTASRLLSEIEHRPSGLSPAVSAEPSRHGRRLAATRSITDLSLSLCHCHLTSIRVMMLIPYAYSAMVLMYPTRNASASFSDEKKYSTSRSSPV